MKIAIGVASLMLVWTANVVAQAAPGTIPEVPATPAQGDGVQRQQRPAEELKSKTPPSDAGQSSTPSRSESMRSRERSFPNDVTAPEISPPKGGTGAGGTRPGGTGPDGTSPTIPAPVTPSPMPGLPMPDKSVPTPGNRG